MMHSSKTLYVHTIGCQMNVYDGEQIARGLIPLGYRSASRPEAADLIVVNTCAIREKAEQKVFSFLGRLALLKEKRPGLVIAVGGCVAQQEGERILSRAPCVDIVFGTRSIDRLPELLADAAASGRPRVAVEMGPDAFLTPRPPEKGEQVSGFVTIMQGCDNHCTYCVVPSVRGPETSKPPEAVLAEVRGLTAAGVREVTLLGQNVNSYGLKEGLCDFPELLGRLNDIEGLERIRFTTSHPKDLSDGLIAAFRDLPGLCKHIHLPIQSGSDRILKRMNRKYTRAVYLDRIDALRAACPEIAVTSDFIAGFPGETDADFGQTLSIIETVGYDSLFAFQYSDRPAAPAARFSDKVPDRVKAARLRRLLDLQGRITLEKHRNLVGRVETVLVDGPAKKQPADGPVSNPTQWAGRTSGNKIVNFTLTPHWKSEAVRPGRLIPVRIEAAFPHSLRGRPIDGGPPRSGAKGEESHAA